MTSADAEYRAQLLDAGLLVETGADGLYGRSGLFEDIVEAIERLVVEAGRDQGADVLRFPPVLPRQAFEKTGYLRSFPNLIGSVSTFGGGDREHAELLQRFEAGEDWTPGLIPTEAMLCPAACHPLYPSLSGRGIKELPEGGRRFDVYGWVFRHEPSLDPARQQAFRQYEFVYLGDPEGAEAHRDLWRDRAVILLGGLGLPVAAEVANDPFFGRLGRMLVANQHDEKLKYEVVAPTSPDHQATAIASANWHRDHFGAEFSIMSAAGQPAHSACVGFGMERITLALLHAHGLDPRGWPEAVRRRLWP